MLPRATANWSSCCTCAVSNWNTVLKAAVPAVYCLTPICVASQAASALRARSAACSREREKLVRRLRFAGGREHLVLISGDQFVGAPRCRRTLLVMRP